jgi:Heterokaryon incompatibility protein (HET)
MYRIYSQTRKVLVWLGPTSEDSVVAMKLIKDLSKWNRREHPIGTSWAPKYDQAECRALERLLLRSYWSRVWIIQEVMLASQLIIYCGSLFVPWESLGFGNAVKLYFFFICPKCPWRSGGDPNSMASFLDANRIKGRPLAAEKYDLRDWMRISGTSISTDPRDKIYGLLAITSDGDRIVVDYSKSLSTVYRDVCSLYANSSILFTFSQELQWWLNHREQINLGAQDQDSIWVHGVMNGEIESLSEASVPIVSFLTSMFGRI